MKSCWFSFPLSKALSTKNLFQWQSMSNSTVMLWEQDQWKSSEMCINQRCVTTTHQLIQHPLCAFFNFYKHDHHHLIHPTDIFNWVFAFSATESVIRLLVYNASSNKPNLCFPSSGWWKIILGSNDESPWTGLYFWGHLSNIFSVILTSRVWHSSFNFRISLSFEVASLRSFFVWNPRSIFFTW